MKFSKSKNGEPIKLLDLRKKHTRKIYWMYADRMPSDKLKTFNILSITSHLDGKVVKTPFLKWKPEKLKKQVDNNGNYQTTIKVIRLLNYINPRNNCPFC